MNIRLIFLNIFVLTSLCGADNIALQTRRMVQELCTIGLRASLGQSFEQQSLPSFLPFSKAVQAELKNLEYKLLVKDRCSVDVYTGDLPGFREGATHYGFIRIFNDRRAGVRLKLHADLSKLELLNAWEYREKEIGQ